MTHHGTTFYIGTGNTNTQQNLYRCSIDFKGKFGDIIPLDQALAVSALAQTPEGQILAFLKQGEQNGPACLNLDGELVSHLMDQSAPACHLAYLDKSRLVLTANKTTGQVTAYQLTRDKQLLPVYQLHFEPDDKPYFVGQTTDDFPIISLMGKNRLLALDKTWKEMARFDFPAGTEPSQLIFHCSKKILYVLGEGDNQIHTLFYDGYGAAEIYQSLSTLPQNASQDSRAGTLRQSPDGRFLYVSNRGHNSLSQFAIAADGSLNLVGNTLLGDHTPGDLVLTPVGDYLLLACPDSNQLLSFAIDPKTGKLTASDQIEVDEPVALLVQNP